MDREFVSRCILAGFVATLVMSLLGYGAPLMGLPRMDFAAMLASMLSDQPEMPGSSLWWLGMIWHFTNGAIIFPVVYAYWAYPRLSGSPWSRGVFWGLVLWLLSNLFVAPLLGIGVFASRSPQPLAMVIGSLLGHFVYGAILGSLAGHRSIRVARSEEDRARAA